MKQIQEMKQKEEKQQMEEQKLQAASPEKKPVERKEQPVNMLSLYFEQKKKKLGFCSVDIFTTHKPAVQEETLTLDFGIQCDIEPSNKPSSAAP